MLMLILIAMIKYLLLLINFGLALPLAISILIIIIISYHCFSFFIIIIILYTSSHYNLNSVLPGFCDIAIKNAIFAPIRNFLVAARIATFRDICCFFSVKFTLSFT